MYDLCMNILLCANNCSSVIHTKLIFNRINQKKRKGRHASCVTSSADPFWHLLVSVWNDFPRLGPFGLDSCGSGIVWNNYSHTNLFFHHSSRISKQIYEKSPEFHLTKLVIRRPLKPIAKGFWICSARYSTCLAGRWDGTGTARAIRAVQDDEDSHPCVRNLLPARHAWTHR
jgi:hypothetical protein